MVDSDDVSDVKICSNCGKLLDDNDKAVRDGSGIVAHMYPHECIRFYRILILNLQARVEDLEQQIAVRQLP